MSDRGDTIVEVMIVLAVLGLAITLSYATANSSLIDVRQAEEHSQATGLAKAEVEDLFQLAAISAPGTGNATTNIFKPTTSFCIHNLTDSPPLIKYAPDTTKPPTYPPNCAFGNIPYTIQITSCDSDPSGCPPSVPSGSGTLVINVTWPSVSGGGTDSATLTYRVHPP